MAVDGDVSDWLADDELTARRRWPNQRNAAPAGVSAGKLPARYRTAVVLRHVQGLSYAEAADVLEQPVGTTKSDVHRGLRLLREALERNPQRREGGRVGCDSC